MARWRLQHAAILGNWTLHHFISSPLDVSPQDTLNPLYIQHFVLIQLKPNHQGANRLGGETSMGELTKGRNIYKSPPE